jgi:hypothetical protein
MTLPRILLITNEAAPGDAAGRIDGYRELVAFGAVASVDTVSHATRSALCREDNFKKVLGALRSAKFDIAVVFSPGNFPGTESGFDALMDALGGRALLYLEGDGWGKGKPITRPMQWWLRRADAVFTTAGEPQSTRFVDLGAKLVLHIANTYCHIKFAQAEKSPPRELAEVDAVLIGNNLARIPGLSGLPGSVGRIRLARRLRQDSELSFRLHGRGWPRTWSHSSIPFEAQAAALREGRISANWDHFPPIADYSSNRLPISLIAGRVHVTTRHPGMSWAPGESVGLFQECSTLGVHERIRELALGDPERVWSLGREAHAWARNRVSCREAARYMLSCVLDDIPPPPADPWGALPGPWRPTGKVA